ENRALSKLAFKTEFGPQIVQVLLYNVQADARALDGQYVARPEVAVKDKGLVLFGDAQALVGDLNQKFHARGGDPYGDFGVLRGIFDGIVHQVGQGQGKNLLIEFQVDTLQFIRLHNGLPGLEDALAVIDQFLDQSLQGKISKGI